METLSRILAGAVLCAALLAPTADAMEFTMVGDTLVMSGPVDGNDLVRLRNHLATHRVRMVLLHDSPGGDLWNGYQLGNRIRQEGLATAVAGKCESACGLIFLSGVERSFTDGRPSAQTMVGLHGAHSVETRQPLPELSPRMAYMIRTMTDRKYPPDLLERTVYPRNAEDIVYAFHPSRYPVEAPGRGVVECLKQADVGFKCTMLQGLDALGIGVITNPEILVLDPETKAVLARLAGEP
jgi:hypothetical protein